MSQLFFARLHKCSLSPDQFAVLWHCSTGISCPGSIPDCRGIVYHLQSLGYLDHEKKPTDRGKELLSDVEQLFKKTKVTGNTDTLGLDYMSQVRKFRYKFPTGRKSDDDEVRDKVARLMQKNPSVTWDIIHAAADLYLSTVTDDRYCMKAGNFIENCAHKTHSIMEYIERVIDGEQEPATEYYCGIAVV